MKNYLQKIKSRIPKVYWGFPFESGCVSEVVQKKRKQGISLLIALMTVAMMMGFVSDLMISSAVNLQLAVSTRDRVKAEYIAKSGYNLAVFLLSMSWGIDLYRAQPSAPAPIKQDLTDSDESLWNTFNSLPPLGASSLELARSLGKENQEDVFKTSGIMNEGSAEIMKLFEDNFTINIQDEGNRINLNDCSSGRCTEVVSKLIALFSCPAEKKFLDNKNIVPAELAYRIKDFINSSKNPSAESGYSDKNSPYEKYTPPYKAKQLPLATLDELKLVEGWDEELHQIFSNYLTIYPINKVSSHKSQININSAPRELLGCLVPEAISASCAENFALKMYDFKKNKKAVSSGDISETLNSLLCYNKSQDNQNQSSNREKWFSNRSEVFRIKVNATTGERERSIEAIVRRIMPKETKNGRGSQKVKRSYQLLFWKMI